MNTQLIKKRANKNNLHSPKATFAINQVSKYVCEFLDLQISTISLSLQFTYLNYCSFKYQIWQSSASVLQFDIGSSWYMTLPYKFQNWLDKCPFLKKSAGIVWYCINSIDRNNRYLCNIELLSIPWIWYLFSFT